MSWSTGESVVGSRGRGEGAVKRVSLRKVASVAGVSPMTASNALSGLRPCAPATAELVKQVARELGYQPDRSRGRNAVIEGELQYVPTVDDLHSAKWLARPWIRRGYDQEECISEAVYAMMRAATTYDPGKGTFYTHMMWCIRSRLRVRFSYHVGARAGNGVYLTSFDEPIDFGDGNMEPRWNLVPDPNASYEESYDAIELLGFAPLVARNLLELRFFLGLEVPEIAELLSRSERWVERRIALGLVQIRAAIDWQFFDYTGVPVRELPGAFVMAKALCGEALTWEERVVVRRMTRSASRVSQACMGGRFDRICFDRC